MTEIPKSPTPNTQGHRLAPGNEAAGSLGDVERVIPPSPSGGVRASSAMDSPSQTSSMANALEEQPTVELEKNSLCDAITSNDIDRLSTDAMKQTRLLVNNPRKMTFDDIKKIYQEAL